MKTAYGFLRAVAALCTVSFLSGCDFIYGVSRQGAAHNLPELGAVKARLESYPEITQVKYWEADGGRPITLTGLKPAEKNYYLTYRGGDSVRGTLQFTKNYKGEVTYAQTLLDMNRRPPQKWVDATWPVMKKIEMDLEEMFGMPELRSSVQTRFIGVEDPDRNVKSNSTTAK